LQEKAYRFAKSVRYYEKETEAESSCLVCVIV